MHLGLFVTVYALRLPFQSRKLKEGRVRGEMKRRSEVPSDGLWQEMARAVNDSHQMTDSVAICRLSPSAWMGNVCACASVCQDRRKADLSVSPGKQPGCRRTDFQPSASTCSGLPPCHRRQCEGSQSTFIITHDAQNNPLRQAPKAGHQDKGVTDDMPNRRKTITEAIII